MKWNGARLDVVELQARSGRESISMVVVRADAALDRQPECPQLVPQASAGDAQQLGGAKLIARGSFEYANEQLPFHQGEALAIQLPRSGRQPLGDELVPVECWSRLGLDCISRCAAIPRESGLPQSRQELGQEHRSAHLQHSLLEYALQLADIARPAVGTKLLARLARHDRRRAIELAPEPHQV